MQVHQYFKVALILTVVFFLYGCGIQKELAASDVSSFQAVQTTPETALQTGEKTMQKIELCIDDHTYTAFLYDNETAHAFMELLPLQVDMQELNGNEKYVYLQQSLPSNAQGVSSIRTGDLMLFGSDCLVLFYQDFPTSYTYTRIGYVENPEKLAQALGTGTTHIVFQPVSRS